MDYLLEALNGSYRFGGRESQTLTLYTYVFASSPGLYFSFTLEKINRAWYTLSAHVSKKIFLCNLLRTLKKNGVATAAAA